MSQSPESQCPPYGDILRSLCGMIAALCSLVSGLAVVVGLVCLAIDGVTTDAIIFLVGGLITGAMFIASYRYLGRPVQGSIAINSAAVSLSWVVATVLAAVPIYAIAIYDPSPNETMRAFEQPLNAWYDGTSALTSGGLTAATNSSELNRSVQLWRSLLQWVGGVGLAVFAILMIEPAEKGQSVYQAETRSMHLGDGPRGTAIRVTGLYVGLTVLCGLLYLVFGMPWWESINHSLITTSTGGLTVTDDSFTSYNARIKIAASVFMWLGAASFASLYAAATGHWKQWWKRTAWRSLIAWTLLIVAAMELTRRMISDGPDLDVLFNIVSAISTCGASSGEIIDYPIAAVWLITLAMFVGGAGDSTAGGVKLNRMVWMLKLMHWQLRRTLGTESGEHRPHWNGSEVDSEEADQRTSRTLVIAFAFGASMALGFLGLRAVYADEIATDQIFFQAVSALSAVGLSMDLTGPDRPAAAKLIEIVLMILGRLEIMAVLFVLPVLLGRVRLANGGSSSGDDE